VCPKSQCDEYTIEDLFDLVFPPDLKLNGHLCMIYDCFLDDSKDETQEHIVLSAGFFGTKQEWGNMRAQWGKILRDEGIDYFKTSEFKSLDGQFERFHDEGKYPKPAGRTEARRIKAALQEVMTKHPRLRGIGITIPVADYKDVCARPEAQGVMYGSPYHRALESVMHETVKVVRAMPGGNNNRVAFVHDEGPDSEELYNVYLNFKKNNPKTAKYMGGFASLDDTLHPPLQAADMLANNTLSIGMEWLKQNRAVEKQMEMQSSIQKLGIWDTDFMLSVLKRNLPRHGKPIPLDLQGEEYG